MKGHTDFSHLHYKNDIMHTEKNELQVHLYNSIADILQIVSENS